MLSTLTWDSENFRSAVPLSSRGSRPMEDCRAWLPMLALRLAPGASGFLADAEWNAESAAAAFPRSPRAGRASPGTWQLPKVVSISDWDDRCMQC